MDEGGVEEYDDKVIHEIVQEDEEIVYQRGLFPDIFDVPAGGCK